MIYKLFILFPLLILMYSKNIKNNSKKKFLLLIFLVLIWVYSTFREYILPNDMLGMDYYSYKSWFFNTSSVNKFSNCGFNYLILFCKLFSNSYIFFLGICNFIIIYCFYKFSKDNSNDYHYSLFLFITFGIFELTFNGLRQCIACGIWLLGFKYLYKNKTFIKYLFFTFIAFLFHNSALTLFLLYPIFKNKLKITYRLILLIPFFVILKKTSVINLILHNFSSIDEIYFNRYMSSSFSTSNLVVFFITLCVIIIAIFKINKIKFDNIKNNICINYTLLLLLFGFIASSHIIYTRMLIYCMPALMISLPYILSLYSGDEKKIINICCTFLFLMLYIL